MFSKWFQAHTAVTPSVPLASARAARASVASASSTRRPSAAAWTRSVSASLGAVLTSATNRLSAEPPRAVLVSATNRLRPRSAVESPCSGMVKHSLQKADLAVAAVVRFGDVETATLEVPVRGVGAAAEGEVGANGPAGLHPLKELRNPGRRAGTAGQDSGERLGQHRAGREVAVAGV